MGRGHRNKRFYLLSTYLGKIISLVDIYTRRLPPLSNLQPVRRAEGRDFYWFHNQNCPFLCRRSCDSPAFSRQRRWVSDG